MTLELLVAGDLQEKFGYDGVELPTINYGEYNINSCNFMYCVGEEEVGWFNQLSKINVQAKEVQQWKEKNCHPSEPIFVKSPNPPDEDNGVVLSTVLSSISSCSVLTASLFLSSQHSILF